MSLRRQYWDLSAGRQKDCEVRTSLVGSDALLEVSAVGEPTRDYQGHDFEDALEALRRDFEAMGRLVLINRFRRDAFVSPMSRQMSNGLSCYLVQPRRPIDSSMLVKCLDPADARYVVAEAEAREFIARWQSRRPREVRFPWSGWLKVEWHGK